MATDDPVNIKATRTSFRVVELLHELDGAGVTELADHLDAPKSTVHDHLRTLHDLEYVVKLDGSYRISTKFLELGEYERENMLVYEIAKPELDRLAEQTGDHANLMIEEHGRGVYIYKSTGTDAARLDTYPGFRTPLHSTALGKAILSEMPDDQIREIVDEVGLPRITRYTITDPDRLFEEIETIREQGYALDRQERAEGIQCVGAPVNADGGDRLAAVSVSGLASKMRGDRLTEEVPELVKRTANKIEVALKYS
ncbi:IclR family transcriptional regulator [Natrinema gelatinilyticum]|uniref:IclR family transcriptional regulator n=1 Tax=Natrinema gelatinilyticum TaxID=2961571 RepID=UPI0020C1ECE9|nr:IclR family transcriptional regulator [Natrinema gelatinilyticum]